MLLVMALAQISPLVEARDLVSALRVDLRYASAHNLVGHPLYRVARCLVRAETETALARASRILESEGFRLVAWDCYRPPRVQRLLWEQSPIPGLVADPRRGSNHSRGTAVDVTLAHLDGSPVDMPTDFDDFSPRAGRAATEGVSPEARMNRSILQRAMQASGFTGIRREWWHFDLRGALKYPVLDEEL